MGALKDLLEGSHLHQPASLDSYATPARSFIQNDISESFLVSGTTEEILPNFGLTVNGKNDKDEKKFLFNTETTKKIISALNSENFTNSGFDYITCKNILNFMIGQFEYIGTRLEERFIIS